MSGMGSMAGTIGAMPKTGASQPVRPQRQDRPARNPGR